MIAHNYLSLFLMGLVVVGLGARVYAEGDVTVISPTTTATTAPSQSPAVPNGTPVIHKSLHRKKPVAVAASGAALSPTATPPTATSATSPAPLSAAKPAVSAPLSVVVIKTASPQPARAANSTPHPLPAPAPVRTASESWTPLPNSLPSVTNPSIIPIPAGPTVETGLPVARHPGAGSPYASYSIPTTGTVPTGKSLTGATTHQSLYASAFSVLPITSSTAGSYSSGDHTTSPPADFVFTNFNKKPRNFYPWKTGIITTMFWIGEPGSNLSPTDNIASAWDENWRSTNRGSDNPYDRNGYAPADHAPTVNTFYVALPFNDLAYPDKARRWLPAGWHRPRGRDGKEVSACKDRWVEIKNAQGRTCYAQWEDVGPLVSDHAEYVFGPERPDTLTRAGLDVSPAVADYLGVNGNNRITSWRFVDDEDVQPGAWLRYEELALLYSAMHQQKSVISISSPPPIQRSAEPIDDPSNVESNKKKVDQSKG